MPSAKFLTRLPSLVVGSAISGVGMFHMWRHAQWGVVDWVVITAIGGGLGVAFNREVIGMIHAWRSKGKPVTEEITAEQVKLEKPDA